MVDVLTSLIGSIAESARYLSTRDNHVVGVISRCESNESLQKRSAHDLTLLFIVVRFSGKHSEIPYSGKL